jgi:hypothetical protein
MSFFNQIGKQKQFSIDPLVKRAMQFYATQKSLHNNIIYSSHIALEGKAIETFGKILKKKPIYIF